MHRISLTAKNKTIQSTDTQAPTTSPEYPPPVFYYFNPNNLNAFPRPIFSLSFSLISA